MAKVIIGDLIYRITGDADGLKIALDNTDKGVKKTGKGITTLTGILTKLGGAIAAAFAIQKIIAFGKEAINAASRAAETANKFGVTFRDISLSAEQATNNLASTYKLAKSEVQTLLSSTGDLLTGFGFTQTEALGTAEAVLKLGSDLASFQNIAGGTPEVVDRLNKALTGETEGLKALGIVVRQDSKEFTDLVKSIQDSTGVSVQLAKSQAILKTALDQSKNAIGDTLRTQGDYANQTRILQSNILGLSESIGKIFIPGLKQSIKFINELFDKSKGDNPFKQFEQDIQSFSKEQLQKEAKKVDTELGRLAGNIIQFEQQISETKNKGRIKFLQNQLKFVTDQYDLLSKKEKIISEQVLANKQSEDAQIADTAKKKEEEKDKEILRLKELEKERLKNEKEINDTIRKELKKIQIQRDLNNIDDIQQAEEIKNVYLSAINKSSDLFDTGSENVDAFTQKLIDYLVTLGTGTDDVINKFQEISNIASNIGEFSGFLTGENAAEIKAVISSIEGLTTVMADNKATATDWVGAIIAVVVALGELSETSDSKAVRSFGKFVKATTDVETGLRTLFPVIFAIVDAVEGVEDAWINLIPIVGPLIRKFQKDNTEAFEEIDESIGQLNSGINSYVENLEAQLLTTAVDIWGEYAKAVIREQSGLDKFLAIRDEGKAEQLKAEQDAELAILQDALNSEVSAEEKALAQKRINQIKNDQDILAAEKTVAEKSAEIDKKIALVKLAIKKAEVEAQFNVKYAELQADEAVALAGTSDITLEKNRQKAQLSITSAYRTAYAALGKASTSAAAGLELERGALTGGLTEADFNDVNSFASKAVEASEQPIVIQLDGKVIASVNKNIALNNLLTTSTK
jgi:hypothetical protein